MFDISMLLREGGYSSDALLEPQPAGGYTITCLTVPNLVTEADTLDEVWPNVTDALTALTELYEDLGKSF